MGKLYTFSLRTGRKLYEYRLPAETFLHDAQTDLPPAIGSKFTVPGAPLTVYRIVSSTTAPGEIRYIVEPEVVYQQYKSGGSVEQRYFDVDEYA